MIDKIIDNLYVSDANSVISQRGQVELKKLQITHILTVSAMGVPERAQIAGVEYKFLFVMDSITQNILANNLLNDGLKFIEDAINDGGNVLVHCEVGMSRSIVFVMAYLMRRYQWSVEKALLMVRTARPIAHPNDGFLRQLQVFQRTGYKADVNSLAHSSDYRKWCSVNGIMPIAAPFEDSGEPSASTTEYHCRKCRNLLFYDEHILKHATSSKNLNDDGFFLDGNTTDDCDFGVLLTPMKWMDLSSYEGKILCPSCSEKLGHYVWGGRICLGVDGKKCGTAVRPWVHIHKGKVDIKPALGAEGRIGNSQGPMIFHPPIPQIVEPGPEENEAEEVPKERNTSSSDRSTTVRVSATIIAPQ
uniref:protein-tyrosine-phosphatase n=1 Tax=Ascaris suum TaxID=6253 RepID=F1L2R9_ASCSU